MPGIRSGDWGATGSRAGSPGNMGTGVSNDNVVIEPANGSLEIFSKVHVTFGETINIKGRVRIEMPDPALPAADFRFDWDFDTE